MKKLLYVLLPLLLASCSADNEPAADETVEVIFTADFPQQAAGSRAGTENLTVDRVVCAVFDEKGTELKNLRREITTVTAGEKIVFSPSLIKGRTYTVAFWADKTGCYNTDDLRAITRKADSGMAETYFDAFTQKTSLTVTSTTMSETVELRRPFAQFNIGVTQEDWDAVASDATFGMPPTYMRITYNGKTTFDAFAGAATGTESAIEHIIPVSGDSFVSDNTTYKRLAMCYVLPDAERQNMDITYSVYAGKEGQDAIRENVGITNVPFQANYRTNCFGRLLTGTVSYSISINAVLSGDNNVPF